MSKLLSSLLLLAMMPLLNACVAALLPLAAAGAISKGEIDRAKAKREIVAAGAVDLASPTGLSTVDAVAAVKADKKGEFAGQGGAAELPEIEVGEEAQQYLSRFFDPVNSQISLPYTDFATYAMEQAAKLEAGEGINSVVLVPRVDIVKPQTVDCAGKPLGVLIDLDDKASSDWAASETLYRQNGLIEAVRSLRASEISVIWLSDQPVSASNRISSILKDADLAETEADDFLFLDRGGDDRKQARRWDAARNYCIVAMAGDKRADFDELYDYLRHPDGAITLEHMFGAGWFLTPPPLVVAPDVEKTDSSEEEG